MLKVSPNKFDSLQKWADKNQAYSELLTNLKALESDISQENNLEYDLRSTEWICNKVANSEEYAKSLYAALCNQCWIKNDVWPILTDTSWSCSWRYAGGIIADMIQQGSYIDWYCSGNEGEVTDEIARDLVELGWVLYTPDK